MEHSQQPDEENEEPSSNPSSRKGIVVSAEQLDVLWKLDFEMAKQLLGLPHRTCTAVPNPNWGQPMTTDKFNACIEVVKRMWYRAALCFQAYLDPLKGWGLQVNSSFEGKLSITNSSNMQAMGWVACAPLGEECPTSHRYLRSPIHVRSYLGGPLSLSNWAPTKTNTIRSTASIKCNLDGLYRISTVKPLGPLTPIEWNYGFTGLKTFPTDMPHKSSWQLPECCEESSN